MNTDTHDPELGKISHTFYYIRRAIYTNDGAVIIKCSRYYVNRSHASCLWEVMPDDTDHAFILWLYTNYPANAPPFIDDDTLQDFRRQYPFDSLNDVGGDRERVLEAMPVYRKPPFLKNLCDSIHLFLALLTALIVLPSFWIYTWLRIGVAERVKVFRSGRDKRRR